VQGRVEGFDMIGVNLLFGNRSGRLRMFWLRRLIFGTFASAAVGLCAFVFDAHLDAFWQGVSRATPLTGANDRLTDLEEHEAVASFPIGHEREIMGLLDHLCERLKRLLK